MTSPESSISDVKKNAIEANQGASVMKLDSFLLFSDEREGREFLCEHSIVIIINLDRLILKNQGQYIFRPIR